MQDQSSENGSWRIRSNDDDNNGGSGEEDRLSSLPDIIIADILSLLPITSAAATSALSRQWRYLWTQINRLDFSSDNFSVSNCSDDFHRTFTTIDHILHQLTSPELRGFCLDFPFLPLTYERERCRSLVESWIRQICSRNPKEIKVNVGCYTDGPLISLPACVFECQYLVELELGEGMNCELPVGGIIIINLINLKKLSIHLYDSSRELIGKLFKSCPLLEDLDLSIHLEEDEHLLDISALCLKRLKIHIEECRQYSEFVIDTPKLKVFEIATNCFPSLRFVKSPSELMEANIFAFYGGRDHDWFCSRLMELLKGISCVRSLIPSPNVLYFMMIVIDDDGALPIFHNLTLLSICFRDSYYLNSLVPFLNGCPNLEALVLVLDNQDNVTDEINWVVPDCLPAFLLTKLKRIEVNAFKGCDEELEFLQFILSNATVLEQLIVRVAEFVDDGTWELMNNGTCRLSC